jgi:hypothetical protein
MRQGECKNLVLPLLLKKKAKQLKADNLIFHLLQYKSLVDQQKMQHF